MTSDTNKRSIQALDVGVKKTKITDFFLVKKKVQKPQESSVQPAKVETTKQESVTVNTKEIDDSGDDEHQQTSPKPALDVSKKPSDNTPTTDDDYSSFCAQYGFDKQKWIDSLSPEVKELLQLEIDTLHITWLAALHKELTKPYFLKLKRFLKAQQHKTVFPPKNQIYSWSHYTPLPELKCLILGQDPYHNHNQAHGLAFSVLEPTKPPPSLQNIYKTIKTDYPKFQIPDSRNGGGGNLTQWAKRGVLLLNTCLTVEAHKPNSHSKQGWETFTQEVINNAINYHMSNESNGFVVMAWGMPAQNNLLKFPTLVTSSKFHIIKTFHPSPFSAAKGFFTLKCFKSCNEWLETNGKDKVDWSVVLGNSIFE